ncbi:hypothetical protein HY631_04575 [Candidatus Uhrbacteria bacterium]|nr:hypothetical protein [Candidatus Uhrbacteria bacterium]
MPAALTTRIPVKDRDGRVIDEKEVATYAGLLARAHEEGLRSIVTRLVQVPSPDNGMTAIVEATVETSKGTFAGIGDANPDNVNRKVAAHLIRMAETRAKARALRDAVNIGTVALEELGGEEEDAVGNRPPVRPAPARAPVREVPRQDGSVPQDRRPAPRAFPRGNSEPAPPRRDVGQPPAPTSPSARAPAREAGDPPMTENQRRWLYRHLSERGFEGQEATDALLRAAEVPDLRDVTKSLASQLIDAWKRDAEADGSGRAA